MKGRPTIAAGLMLVCAGSGCLDILSYRFLGEVFPSAMTGNLALLGRSLGEGNVAAALRNVCAFGAFFAGLLVGAVLLRGGAGKARFLLTLALQAAMLGAFAFYWEKGALGSLRFVLIGAASWGMGMQSAVAHRIGLQGVSTTYFTGTTTNIAFGLVTRGQPLAGRLGWPLLALLCYIGGAALAGWGGNETLLPAVPAVATLLLAIAIAVTRLDRPASA